jgi:hypothetical protein
VWAGIDRLRTERIVNAFADTTPTVAAGPTICPWTLERLLRERGMCNCCHKQTLMFRSTSHCSELTFNSVSSKGLICYGLQRSY